MLARRAKGTIAHAVYGFRRTVANPRQMFPIGRNKRACRWRERRRLERDLAYIHYGDAAIALCVQVVDVLPQRRVRG